MPNSYYVAIVNQPGYLPDSNPAEFVELSDAESYLCDELHTQIDFVYEALDAGIINRDRAAAELWKIHNAKQDVRKFGIATYGNLAYEIQEQFED